MRIVSCSCYRDTMWIKLHVFFFRVITLDVFFVFRAFGRPSSCVVTRPAVHAYDSMRASFCAPTHMHTNMKIAWHARRNQFRNRKGNNHWLAYSYIHWLPLQRWHCIRTSLRTLIDIFSLVFLLHLCRGSCGLDMNALLQCVPRSSCAICSSRCCCIRGALGAKFAAVKFVPYLCPSFWSAFLLKRWWNFIHF